MGGESDNAKDGTSTEQVLGRIESVVLMKIRFNTTNISGAPDSGGKTGKGCGSFFFGLFFLMGMMFVVLILGEGLKQAAPWFWVETRCTITSSTVEETGDDEKPYRPAVRYRYEVDGRQYQGETMYRGLGGSSSFDNARDAAARYTPGDVATCRFDADHPAVSVLERRLPWIFLVVLFPMIFVAIGAIGLWAIWRGEPESTESGITSISGSAGTGGGPKFMIGLGLLFTVVGAAVFTFLFAVPALRTLESLGWETRPCTIVRSTVRSWSTDDGTSYRGDVLYEYSAHGRTWRSNRVTFFSALASGRTQARAMRERYPSGADFVAWVDPEEPNRSLLEREFRVMYLLGLLPLLFLIAGAALVRSGWKKLHSEEKRLLQTTRDEPRSAGPRVLKPQLSPVGKVFGTLFFALFWNGIVSIFVWQAWKGWQSGHPDWFLSIFMIPFVLVGIASFFFVGHFALALANPRPRITLQQGEPCLGDELRVDWHFTGRSSRLTHLEIFLEGREEATYQRGTDTVTDREVFATHAMVETGNDWEIPRGTATLAIPDDTMHSFAAGNNKIIWEIKVKGEIPRWPDVDQNFPITLHPLRLEDV